MRAHVRAGACACTWGVSCLNDMSLKQVEGLEALGSDGRVVGRAKARNATEAAGERLWTIVGDREGMDVEERFWGLFWGDFLGEEFKNEWDVV